MTASRCFHNIAYVYTYVYRSLRYAHVADYQAESEQCSIVYLNCITAFNYRTSLRARLIHALEVQQYRARIA